MAVSYTHLDVYKRQAVQRMQDYIECHLEAGITIADLARVSLFSPWHSYRLFRTYTGLTPAEYIRKLRLSRSAVRLKRENCRVIDVTFDLGFGSVDGYQRAFYREFGCHPDVYKRQAQRDEAGLKTFPFHQNPSFSISFHNNHTNISLNSKEE